MINVPTTEDIKERYIQPQSQGEALDPDAAYVLGKEFDLWLAAHDAEVLEAAERRNNSFFPEKDDDYEDVLITDHVFQGVMDHFDDNECTFRNDGTDLTYCGEEKEHHLHGE